MVLVEDWVDGALAVVAVFVVAVVGASIEIPAACGQLFCGCVCATMGPLVSVLEGRVSVGTSWVRKAGASWLPARIVRAAPMATRAPAR